jgi:Cft2 family RNA processing exonuclease
VLIKNEKNRITYLGLSKDESLLIGYLLDINGYRVLVDCGVEFADWPEGDPRREQYGRMVRGLVFPPRIFDERKIDAVLLTHGHLDHAGGVPILEKKGYLAPHCKIWAHPVTHMGLPLSWKDSIKRSPYLFGEDEVNAALERRAYFDADGEWEILTGNSKTGVFVWTKECGHLAGARTLILKIGEERVAITGDTALHDQPTVKGAKPFSDSKEVPDEYLPTQILGTDLTSGARIRKNYAAESEALMKEAQPVLEKDGKVIVPAFAFGRGQNVALLFASWMRWNRHEFPIYVDGMIRKVFRIYQELLRIEIPKSVQFVESADHRLALANSRGPMVIIATGGMGEGPVTQYYRTALGEKENLVAVVGYAAPGTTNEMLLRQMGLPEEERKATLFDNGTRIDVSLRAQVKSFGLSGHLDAEEACEYFGGIVKRRRRNGLKRKELKRIALTHGTHEAKQVAASGMYSYGLADTVCFGEPWSTFEI